MSRDRAGSRRSGAAQHRLCPGRPPLAVDRAGRHRSVGGDGWAVSVGLWIGHIGADTSATSSGSVWYFGAAVLGEIRVAHSADRRTEGYVLVGANVAGATTSSSTAISGTTTGDGGGDNGVSGKPAQGFLAGFGLWLAPNLGIGAELGESYVNVPLGTDTETVVSASGGQSEQTSDLRTNILSTFGDINVALTFRGRARRSAIGLASRITASPSLPRPHVSWGQPHHEASERRPGVAS